MSPHTRTALLEPRALLPPDETTAVDFDEADKRRLRRAERKEIP
jgi:hypothetical protein